MQQTYINTDPSKLFTNPPLEFGDEFRNEDGAIRNYFVRSQFFSGNIGLKKVTDVFREWRDDPEYFILCGIGPSDTCQSNLVPCDWDFDQWYKQNDFEVHYKFIKASKRGNDVYKYLIEQKTKPLEELKDVLFFRSDWGVKSSRFLFITLTYDTNICGPVDAWNNIGYDFNRFCSNIKKQYGRIEFFRVWESTQNYYPHVHMLVGFKDHEFQVFEHHNKEGVETFRIPYLEKEKISSYWHSNIDVQAMDDTQGAIKELVKYITKDLCSNKGDVTNSMIWLFRKQSYSITRGFVKMIDKQFADVDVSEPSNADLITHMCNSNQSNINWEFLGILRGVDLRFDGNNWSIELKKPPPFVMDLIKKEYLRWHSSHSKSDRAELFNINKGGLV